MNYPKARPGWIALVIVSAILLGLWVGSGDQNAPRPISRPGQSTATPTETPNSARTTASPSAAFEDSPSGWIARTLARLRSGDQRSGEVAALRKALLTAPRSEAIAAIVAFLKSGQDALTGEAFTIAAGGELEGAPTMRVLMLDLLGRLARDTGAPEALALSREVLEMKTSADEWAIALRNVGWATPKDHTYLHEKVREMIEHRPWRQRPTAGFLEAFDVIVFSRGVTLIPALSEMVRGEDPALQASAAVAMDRLAEVAPLEAMNFLNRNQNELAQRPFLRADYFSKADLSNPAQRQAVELYLSRPDVAVEEKAKMLSVAASPGTFAQDSLLTEPPPDEFPPQRNAALRKGVEDWLKTGRFPELRGSLLQLQNRLSEVE